MAWPQDDLLDVLPMQAAAGVDAERFGVWLMIERDTNTVVGDVGFLGLPDDGLLEIGFSVTAGRWSTTSRTTAGTWSPSTRPRRRGPMWCRRGST